MESSTPNNGIDRKRYRVGLTGLVRLIVVGALIVISSLLLLIRNSYYSPLLVTEPQQFEIKAGSSFTGIAHELEAAGIINSASILSILARITGVANSIQAGEYEITPDMSSADLLAKVTAGEVVQYRVTFVEGWTLQQAIEALHNHEAIAATIDNLTDEQLVELMDINVSSAEGMVHPETYFFDRGTSDLEILLRARDRQQAILNQLWENRIGVLPYETPYQALVMASIIEKESGLTSEKAEIAGVFVRRLEQNMRLQSDPTVIYGLGSNYDGDITRENLQERTAYNTYRINGLPPTPIAIPGQEAIAAALNPAEGDYLYFVATGDGGHQFSVTLEEHNAAVNRYQRSGSQEQSSN